VVKKSQTKLKIRQEKKVVPSTAKKDDKKKGTTATAASASKKKTSPTATTAPKSSSKKQLKKPTLSKADRILKAKNAAKLIKKGTNQKSTRKIRTSVHFYRPKTLHLDRKPKYARRSVPRTNKLDQFQILKHPLTTESAMKKIEENNTLVFIVDIRSNKNHIRSAVNKMYNIKPLKINTLVRPDGLKKAYVRLSQEHDALDTANRIGII